ncbi:hypothetical protein ACPSXX_28280 [Escherichia coli]
MRLFSAATAAVICAFTSGCAALAFLPSVAGTTSVTSACEAVAETVVD